MLVRQTIIWLAIDSISKGIEQHIWNENELAAFSQKLSNITLQKDLLWALRGERACVNTLLIAPEEAVLHQSTKIPGKCIRPYQVSTYDRIMQHTLDNLEVPPGKPWNKTVPVFPELPLIKKSNLFVKALNLISVIDLPAMNSAIEKTSANQTVVYQTLIACALERYRIARGSYPVSLDVLIPEYLAGIPKEPTTGQPMHYKLLDDKKFLLWAPSWNLQTLGGKPGEYRGDGDIVWNQPISNKEKPSATAK